MNFFSPDSKFARMMTSVGEMMLLNACWLLASIPLVTIGAANAAIYTMMGRRLRREDTGTVVPFFRAWLGNLKPGTAFWLAQVLISASLGLILVMKLPTFLKVVAAILLILVTMVFSVIYPQIARFRNRWFPYVRNAVILLVLRLKWVTLNLLLLLTPVIVFLLAPVEFLRFGVVWLLFGFSGLFYLSAKLMQKILEPLEELSAKQE